MLFRSGAAALCGCCGYASATAKGWSVGRRKPNLTFGAVLGGRSVGASDSTTKASRRLGVVILAWAGAWCWLSWPPAATATGPDTAVDVQPIAEVRSLPVAELATNPHVRIRGVVTLRPEGREMHAVVQDETAGIYVNFSFAKIGRAHV